ncbi:NBS-LRR type resistance protein [Cucumis melo var. makuwa]|uniref:NBS-LRR type resistance protein n=1 Tax=Cucumis melo var. makuwa TaxID=1194695 RepID=A0A5A7UT77_CUCMM|nr:NBS-LRR type resistance protein [Cucumis melo var. makuwa]
MTKDESVSEYNERVLEITNDSLLLGEKISESKIVRKMLGSLHRKFDMKITAIEEDQDITTLKLDELFGALLTFEMTMSNREINQDESIALLTKQFSKMARKLKSMNNAGTSVKTGRHDGENSTRKVNDFSYRRNSDHGMKKEDDSDDDEVDHGMNAFTACITEINSEVDSGYSENEEDEELTLEKLKILRKEDLEARAIKKERIRLNGKKNKRLMGVISSLKVKLKEAHNEQNGSSKYGLGFDASIRSDKITPESSGSVERTHQSRDPEGCTYQSSDPKGYTYQSSDPEGCTYQSSDPEGYTYPSLLHPTIAERGTNDGGRELLTLVVLSCVGFDVRRGLTERRRGDVARRKEDEETRTEAEACVTEEEWMRGGGGVRMRKKKTKRSGAGGCSRARD